MASYMGPRSWELGGLLARHRRTHARALLWARDARAAGNHAGHARLLAQAELARLQVGYLKAEQKRLWWTVREKEMLR